MRTRGNAADTSSATRPELTLRWLRSPVGLDVSPAQAVVDAEGPALQEREEPVHLGGQAVRLGARSIPDRPVGPGRRSTGATTDR